MTPDAVRERRVSAFFSAWPASSEMRTAGIVMSGSVPPRSVTGPATFSATTIPTAPAFCTIFALMTKAQVPRSTSAILPFTASAFCASSGVQAMPVPFGWSTTGISSARTSSLDRGGPKVASPTS